MPRTRALAALVFLIAFGCLSAAALAGRGDQPARLPKAAKQPRAAERSEATQGAGSMVLSSDLLARDEAVASALRLVDTSPNDPASWRVLGSSLADLGAFGDAIVALERAVDLDKNDADSWADLGAAQLRAGLSSRAVSTLRRAVRVEPFHARAHYNLGLAYSDLDRYEASLDEFEAALMIDPSLADPAVNPDAASNPHLPIVRLRVYMRRTGGSAAMFSMPGARE